MSDREFLGYTGHSVDTQEAQAAYDTVMNSWLSQGQDIQAFENAILSFLEADENHFAISTSSGTAALHIGLAALGIGPGDEVIVPSLSWVATANAVRFVGAKPIFADIDPKRLGLGVDQVESCVTKKTKCILPVHYAGIPVDLKSLREFCDSKSLLLFDDAAHAFGSKLKNKESWEFIGASNLTSMSAFSFHPAKNITTGEGGILIVQGEDLALNARKFSNHGVVRDREQWNTDITREWGYDMAIVGFNYRMNTIAASIGLVQLKKFISFKKKRDSIFQIYTERLQKSGLLQVPEAPQNTDPCWNLYPLRFLGGEERRNDLIHFLRKHQIGTMIQYPLIHKLDYYRNEYKNIELTNSEKFERECLCIPLHANLSSDDCEYICDKILEFCES